MFHRFGENTVPSTNIRLDQFDAMLAALKSGGYHVLPLPEIVAALKANKPLPDHRSEEHTSELQSLMRISYAVFCLKKKNNKQKQTTRRTIHKHIENQKKK